MATLLEVSEREEGVVATLLEVREREREREKSV